MRGDRKGPRLFKRGATSRLRHLLLALVALGAGAIAIATYATGVLKALEGTTVNARFSIRGSERAPSNLVVVAVDAKTFQDLNLQWPFPRAVDGQLINHIASEHPAVIAYDIELADKSTLGTSDELALLNAIGNSGGVTVFATTAPDVSGNGNMRFLGSGQGTKLLHEEGSQPAAAIFPNQSGGVIRQMVYSDENIKTMPVVAAEVASHKKISRSEFGAGDQWIDFLGPAGTVPYVSFSTVEQTKQFRTLPKNFFRGKVVVVGATDSSLQDLHATSTDSVMPGPEIQANSIETVLRGFPLRSAPGWINVVLIVLLAVAVPLGSLRLKPVAALSLAVALGVLFTVGVQLAFNSGRVVSFVYPLTALILSGIGSLAVQLVTEAFERIRVRDMFTRFVPEDVVDEVLASSDGLRLGGVQREGTIMFSDVRGFTTLVETLAPAQVIDLLNHYLSEMSDAILDHGGTLVAYMGDGIFAVFGAPLPQDDHADRALAAAREMLDVRLPRFNQWLRSEGLSEGVRMGIGLNSGMVMSGHVGSERRVEYAAVGDTTNTASRIESLTKGTPHQLFLSGATKDMLVTPATDLVHVGETEIRGRTARLELWSVKEGSDAEPGTPAEPVQSSVPPEPEPLQAPGSGV